MKKISFDEFFACVSETHPALLCDTPYPAWYTEDTRCYLADGCAVYYASQDLPDGSRSIICHVHPLSPDADFPAACHLFYEKIEAETPRERPCHRFFHLYYTGPLTDALSRFLGFRVFTRPPAHVCPDRRVHELTRADAEEIARLCDRAAYRDSPHLGAFEWEADSFARWDFDGAEREGRRLLGYRMGDTLAGIASWRAQEPGKLGFLEEIYVPPPLRRQGIGKVLVEAAAMRLPERTWVYQTARDNAPSMALAGSAGFSFYGAALILL